MLVSVVSVFCRSPQKANWFDTEGRGSRVHLGVVVLGSVGNVEPVNW